MKFAKISLVTSFLLFSSLNAFAEQGTAGGGGGFAFSTSSNVLLNLGIAQAVRDLQTSNNQQCLNYALTQVKGPSIDLNKMISIIQNTRRNYSSAERTRINEKGQVEPLNFDHGDDSKGPYIEALGKFFVSFAWFSPDNSNPNLIKLTEKLLLHEASHYFRYSESQALHFARVVSFGAGRDINCNSLVKYSRQTINGEPYILIKDLDLSLRANQRRNKAYPYPNAIGIGFGEERNEYRNQWINKTFGASHIPWRLVIGDESVMETLSARPYKVSTDAIQRDGKVKVWVSLCTNCVVNRIEVPNNYTSYSDPYFVQLDVTNYPNAEAMVSQDVIDYSKITVDTPKISTYYLSPPYSGDGSTPKSRVTVEYGRLP